MHTTLHKADEDWKKKSCLDTGQQFPYARSPLLRNAESSIRPLGKRARDIGKRTKKTRDKESGYTNEYKGISEEIVSYKRAKHYIFEH